ncbi:hypothetical protein TpMuguga_04g00085 [Theileria parva strain Muguga]|uniref:Uncharacterized protein n=1 Tax=Theileria parva TaxID=5875 RepID=Q4N3A2_THEPA|nr:uncharacterized protein TpMuguga_04g00085 [Theileria parva strain Muguga]EAN31437.1 hypothetical protein TpMuguga_04g00085 [Theileria parva strain Muguga]|eukprot:XP_763720.1 hypothetical protein [Theileria parva strain Muguga]
MTKDKSKYKAELINGKPFIYRRSTPQGTWEDITHTRHNVDQLEFYDYDLNLTTVSQCETKLSGLIFRILLNIICLHIKLGDKLIWNYYASKVQASPLELLFNLKKNTMSLQLRGEGVVKLNMNGYLNDWVKPGRPLEKFKTKRTIRDGPRVIHLIDDDEKCDEIVASGHTLDNKPNTPHKVAYVVNLQTAEKRDFIKF